MLVNCTIYHWH